MLPTLNQLDDFRVRGLRDPLSVDLDDDVVLADSGAVRGAARTNSLHEDRLIPCGKLKKPVNPPSK
jgi:hypothetical protein